MPKTWFDFHANKIDEGAGDEEKARRDLNLRILADRKPYFMRYIYPPLMKDYNAYIRNTNAKCLREFRVDLDTLLAMPDGALDEKQRTFLQYYRSRMPVGTNDCVMNRICRRVEAEFDGYLQKHGHKEDFDCSIMKGDAAYTNAQYYAVKKLCDQHIKWTKAYFSKEQKAVRRREKGDSLDIENRKRVFAEECLKICSNAETLCSIVVDLCYKHINTMEFAWDICAPEILGNLCRRGGGWISYPVRDEEGDIVYRGQRFIMERKMSAFAGDGAEREGVGGAEAVGDDAWEEPFGDDDPPGEILL